MGSVICKERVFSFASASASFAPLFCPNFNFNMTMSISKHSAASVPRRNRARRTFSRKAIAVSCCVCRRPTIDARSATRIWLNLPSNLWMNSVYNYCWSANFFHERGKIGNFMNDLNAVTSVYIIKWLRIFSKEKDYEMLKLRYWIWTYPPSLSQSSPSYLEYIRSSMVWWVLDKTLQTYWKLMPESWWKRNFK